MKKAFQIIAISILVASFTVHVGGTATSTDTLYADPVRGDVD